MTQIGQRVQRAVRLLVAGSFLATGLALASTVPGQAAEATQTVGSSLGANQRLLAGHQLVSPNGEYHLIMQGDGNLVIYAYGLAVWSSGTRGSGLWAVMQSDGNFVIYTKAGKAVWNTGTEVSPKPTSVRASLESNGNFEIVRNGAVVWVKNRRATALPKGQVMRAGQSLHSPNGEYELVLQGDGNLVIYAFGRAVWWTGTSGSGLWAAMQTDGNFVIYTAGGKALWWTGTSGSGSFRAQVESNGSLVIVRSGAVVWTSGSHAHVLPTGKRMLKGQSLISANGAYELLMQGDGNLVLYKGSRALWSTGTNEHGASARILSNHTFAVVDGSAGGIWTTLAVSGASGSPTLELLNTGNVVLYSGGKLLWDRYYDPVAYRMISLAESQDQYGKHVVETPDNSNCNPYTYYWWVRGERPYSVNNHCVAGTRSEEWCSDFAQWVWASYGVNTGDTTGAAISFVSWGENYGAFHRGSTNDPEPGDTLVWGNMTYGAHVAIIAGVDPGGVLSTVNGNGGPNTDRVDLADVTENSTIDGYPIVGYISPVNSAGKPYTEINSAATRTAAARAKAAASLNHQSWLDQVHTMDGGH